MQDNDAGGNNLFLQMDHCTKIGLFCSFFSRLANIMQLFKFAPIVNATFAHHVKHLV